MGPSTAPSLQERGGTRTTIMWDDSVELRGAGGRGRAYYPPPDPKLNTSNDLFFCPGRNICRKLDRLLPVSSVHNKRQTVVPKRHKSEPPRTVSRKGHGPRCDIAIVGLRLLLRKKIERTQ